MKLKTCFILMPFSKTDKLSIKDLDFIYEHIICKAVDEYRPGGRRYFDTVERFSSKVGSIISGIVNSLNSADLVIADLTGLNHNVMYELGVRHALRRGTIIITQDLNILPSDLRDYMTVGYEYSKETLAQANNYAVFRNELHKSFVEVLTTNKFDSPVLSYLKQKQRYRDEEEVEKLKANAIVIDAICNECYEIGDMIKALEEENFVAGDEMLTIRLFNWKLNNLQAALNELKITYTSSILYENIINSRSVLNEVIKIFSMNELFFNAGNIPDWPQGFLGRTSIKECLEKPLVNVFALESEELLRYTNMKELFKDKGILEVELLDCLVEYANTKAKDLGVNVKEIEKILES